MRCLKNYQVIVDGDNKMMDLEILENMDLNKIIIELKPSGRSCQYQRVANATILELGDVEEECEHRVKVLKMLESGPDKPQIFCGHSEISTRQQAWKYN